MEIFRFFVGRGRKVQAVFFTACAFARPRGCRTTCRIKTTVADRRSVSVWGGSERKVWPTSGGAWVKLANNLRPPLYIGTLN